MTRWCVAASLSLVLAGCTADSALYRNALMNDGSLSIRRSEAPGRDYVVLVKGGKDFGYNADDPRDRARIAVALASQQCSGARVVGEHAITVGQNLFGPSRNYEVYIKC